MKNAFSFILKAHFVLKMRRLSQGGAYFKFRETDNINRRDFLIFCFKIRTKHKFSLSINSKYNEEIQISTVFPLFYCLHSSSICHFGLATSRIWLTILVYAKFRGAVIIRGRRLFQCGHSKVQRLLEGGAYLRLGAYQRKYGTHVAQYLAKQPDNEIWSISRM